MSWCRAFSVPPLLLTTLAAAGGVVHSATVDGFVRESAGTAPPIADARVTLFTPDLSFFREVRSATDGSYAIADVPEGEYQIGASAPSFEYQQSTATVTEPGITKNFSLGPDLEAGRWTIIGDSAPQQLHANSATLLPDGRIIFCHGTIDAIVFDPLTGDKAFPPASSSNQRCHMPTLLEDGTTLFVGGTATTFPADAVATVKTFDPRVPDGENPWSLQPEINSTRWYPGMARLADGRLLALGGATNPSGETTDSTEIYDPITRTWSLSASMSQPSVYSPSLLLLSGEVLKSWYPPELFNPEGESWRAAGAFVQSPRRWPDDADHSLVLLEDGRAAAIGIGSAAIADPTMLELFDPTTNGWSLGPNAEITRSSPEVVLMPDGRVLVAGGELQEHGLGVPVDGEGQVYLTDIYDPVRNLWRRASDLNVARGNHATTLLVPDGRIITTGGSDGTPGDLTIEAFEPPYLFRGVRPQIDSIASSDICLGGAIEMNVSRTASPTKTVLIGSAAVTHWVDGGIPRLISLPFTVSDGLVDATVPADPVAAPQGHYILFALVDGIPSEGRIVRLIHNEAAPVEGLLVEQSATTVLSWNASVSSGPAVAYDIAGGSLADLVGTGTFDNGECLGSRFPDTRFEDLREDPSPGDGYYYLIRSRNSCFIGTYGTAARDAHGRSSGAACP